MQECALSPNLAWYQHSNERAASAVAAFPDLLRFLPPANFLPLRCFTAATSASSSEEPGSAATVSWCWGQWSTISLSAFSATFLMSAGLSSDSSTRISRGRR
jgi:hypothetical protein